MIVRRVQNTIREIHRVTALGAFPERIAIVFHELLARQQGQFRDAIHGLRAAGYTFVMPDEYCERPRDGETKLALISFDDSFQQWHRALPLFDELGLKVTFYTNSGPLRDVGMTQEIEAFFDRIEHYEERVPLSREELLELHACGHNIGCHTHWHHNLALLPQGKWDGEIAYSKAVLEDMLGRSIDDFSYPFGMRRDFSEALRQYCHGIGFKRIANARPGRLHEREINPLSIQRTRWHLDNSLERNLEDIRIDGRFFETVTGRSAIL